MAVGGRSRWAWGVAVAWLVGAGAAMGLAHQFAPHSHHHGFMTPAAMQAAPPLMHQHYQQHLHHDHHHHYGHDVPSPHAHYLCWRAGAMERWECAAFSDWLQKSIGTAG